MLQLQTVAPDTLELLKTISSKAEMQGLRLVGGTALALQYGHRQSVDLDFFGSPLASQEDTIDMLSSLGNITIHNRTDKILQVVLRGIKVDVIDYSRYGWIDPPVVDDGIVLASPRDIAAMKINAIEGRGSRKDFVDVYMLLQHYTLSELLDFYSMKYPNYSIFRALLSLTYFDDAETQAMPKMFIPQTWEEIKAYISDKVKEYNK
jgi:predicted nucleotidyltransferase component of viral defense system